MKENTPEIAIIVAMDQKRGIGNDGKLPWPRIPEDMARFKELTVGHPVIMGRKTYESLPPKYRPLPDRPNIVLTRELGLSIPRCYTSHSISEALQLGELLDSKRICVIGGGEIYKKALPLADVLYLTNIDADFEADTFFPEFSDQFSIELKSRASHHNGLQYSFEDLARKK
nr:Dihydrofolate reductase [uncultured bacterium]